MGSRAVGPNRRVLWFLGLILLALGVLALLARFGLFGDSVQGQKIVPDGIQSYVGDQGAWLWPVAALVAVLLGLYGLRLVVLQVTSDRVSALDLTRDRHVGEVVVAASAITDALQRQIDGWPGVDGGSVRVVQHRGSTTLVLKVETGPRADLADVRRRLGEQALPELRQAMGDDLDWDVRVELEPAASGAGRRELV